MDDSSISLPSFGVLAMGKPVLRSAMVCDRGKIRLCNEDAACCDPALGLFAVADGMGGLPAGGAAAHILVRALPRVVERALRFVDPTAEDSEVHEVLTDAMVMLSRAMYEQARPCHGIRGWGATLVAIMIRGRKAHIFHVGDSRAYLLRDGRLIPLTDDHSYVSKLLAHGRLITEDYERKNRYLVAQHVAMRDTVDPDVRTLYLTRGDRLLLCTDGLSAPVSEERIAQVLREHTDPNAACQALIDEANTLGGPDNITAMIVDFDGVTEAESEPATPMAHLDLDDSTAPQARRTADWSAQASPLEAELRKLEEHLAWLVRGVAETTGPASPETRAAAERLLGSETWNKISQEQPNTSPLHLVHRACTETGSAWRQSYEQAINTIEPILPRLTDLPDNICAAMSNDDIAQVMRTLWRELRSLERRYFVVCRRDDLDLRERTLELLIEHMIDVVRSMIGLLTFLPRFDAGESYDFFSELAD